MPEVVLSGSAIRETLDFCDAVIGETFDRFHKSQRERYERIYVGKLGELAFGRYLSELGFPQDTSSMFEVYPGTLNVDAFDFSLPGTDEVIDIKTAYKPYHSRILVPSGPNGQWDQMPKDYYVGVKLLGILSANGSVNMSDKLNVRSQIAGYAPRLHRLWQGPTDFGEGSCMWIRLRDLLPIRDLLSKFKTA